MKGVELGTDQADERGHLRGRPASTPDRVAVLSGPEPGRGDRAGAARRDRRRLHRPSTGAERLQGACPTPYFRPYTNTDVIGCELGGAVKNVIALAVRHGRRAGLGRQHPASLITRGLAETARLGVALGADP